MSLTATRAARLASMSPERFISVGILITLVTVIAQTACQSIDFGFFNLGYERSTPILTGVFSESPACLRKQP